jgi:hypothetical protein
MPLRLELGRQRNPEWRSCQRLSLSCVTRAGEPVDGAGREFGASAILTGGQSQCEQSKPRRHARRIDLRIIGCTFECLGHSVGASRQPGDCCGAALNRERPSHLDLQGVPHCAGDGLVDGSMGSAA